MIRRVSIPAQPDAVRRRLLMAILAGLIAGMPRLAFAQTMDSDAVSRTLRSLRIWWNNMTREPDAGDEEAKDVVRFVAGTPRPASWSDGGITVSWIGHSTFLINLEGSLILTDPIFSQKAGVSLLGLATVGLQRLVPAALRLKELPPLDLVLVSHAHMDHYDVPTLGRLSRDVPVIMAQDTQDYADGLGLRQVRELGWGESAGVDGVRIEALPVRHWGRRYPWDRDRGYNGLLLTKHKRSVLFAGDTAFTDRLPEALRGRRPDVAILPIGGYNPYIYSHASPEQAWDLYHAMEARYLIPMHWRTFRLSHERPFEPYERLSAARHAARSRIALHQIGETWSLPA
jgi:L-ascorbate metabolism protein UlaG (beta-lactamase superfamily)